MIHELLIASIIARVTRGAGVVSGGARSLAPLSRVPAPPFPIGH